MGVEYRKRVMPAEEMKSPEMLLLMTPRTACKDKGKCVRDMSICNGIPDCADSSDEGGPGPDDRKCTGRLRRTKTEQNE